MTTLLIIFQGDILPPAVPPPQENTLWAVKPAEKAKYDSIFEVHQPRVDCLTSPGIYCAALW